ncbi:hypothetical protein LTR85_009785 [Meristemomyces frigidus]|nr:hypothetical protein LTR85_009785 [Meristemomyces frigidus]
MPPAILADSDDDGDDLILEPDADQPQPLPGSNDVPAVDGTNEQSTGSTERLQNQIRSAERAFFTASPKKMATNAPAVRSSGSPTTQANKRRRTAAVGSVAASSAEKRAKRMKTYSAKHSSALAVDQETAFAGLREDGQAAATSQSARFTEHSDANSSNGLPAGSIKAGFVNHEPNVMFRDTGSTAVDNESSQQRMIERALSSKKGLSTSVSKLLESDEPKSSSFPWSASEQTQSTKKATFPEDQPGSGDNRQMHPDHVQGEAEQDMQPSGTSGQSAAPVQHQVGEELRPANGLEQSWQEILEAAKTKEAARKADPTPKLRSSPRVEIAAPPVEAESPVPSAGAAPAASVPKSTKGRKRMVQEEATDPLNSDDIAVGLPKERYMPRPSRRRATQIEEESIDFSVRPEKAAKLKRTKTTAVAKYAPYEGTSAQQGGDGIDAEHAASGAFEGTTEKAVQALRPDAINDRQTHSTDTPKHAETAKPPLQLSKSTSVQPEDSADSPIKTLDDDEIFVKPTPKAKSSARTKRSHTTLFEDHVDFAGSQRAPSLTQQQAKRKSALKGIGDEVTQATQRKRRKVVDEDDDEDELALEPPKEDRKAENHQAEKPDDQEEEPPKKRGRGRPPKAAASTKAKSAEKVLEDSDAEPEEDHDSEPEEDEVPKKKGRGRPAKAAAAKTTEAKQQPAKVAEVMDKSTTQMETVGDAFNNSDALPTSPCPSKPRTPSIQAPTPSPDKIQAAKTTLTPQQKPSPTSHSPLKSSSKVPLRVGLSKRQRIPPLLRMMKAPKR